MKTDNLMKYKNLIQFETVTEVIQLITVNKQVFEQLIMTGIGRGPEIKTIQRQHV